MSAITLTPGKQFAVGEKWTTAGLNQLGAPTGAVPAASITATELSAGVNAALAAISSAIASVVAKSADFTVAVADKGKLYNITNGGTNVTAFLPAAATAGNGWYVWLRKADTAAGLVLTNPTTQPAATSLSKQDHCNLLVSDGTNYYVTSREVATIDATGNVTIAALGNLLLVGTLIQLGATDATAPALKRSGTLLAFRLGDDSGDAPIACKDLTYSGRTRPSADIPITALDIDWSKGNSFYKTLAANSTFTFSNLADQTIVVELTNTASNWTVTWPAGITWPGGAAPTQTTGAKTDVYTFKRTNGVIRGIQQANFS